MDPIFSRKLTSNEKEIKFTGAHLPLKLNAYLTMFSMATDTPKSTIICDSLESWKNTVDTSYSIDNLIKVLGEKAAIRFNLIKAVHKPNISQFVIQLRKELQKKGINDLHIHQIITICKDGTKQ